MNFPGNSLGKILAIIPAGGEGSRLYPLTKSRAKPAIRIGATHRLIDISLSNCLNSMITRIFVIVQKTPQSLIRHLEGYQQGVAQMRGQFVRVLAPPKIEDRFFLSDADCLVQLKVNFADSLNNLQYVLVAMADQILKIDYRDVLNTLVGSLADAILVYREVPIETAQNNLGVVEIGTDEHVLNMEEKPPAPKQSRPGYCLANLAMYLFSAAAFFEMLEEISTHPPHTRLSTSGINWLIRTRRVIGYNLMQNHIPGVDKAERGFFADTGTIETLFETQMAMCHREPKFNFFSKDWPIFTAATWPLCATKIDAPARIDQALFGWNVIVQDRTTILESIIGSGSIIGHDARLTRSILHENVVIGPGAVLENVIVDSEVHVPAGCQLGPRNLPPGTLKFQDAYELIKTGEEPPLYPVLSEQGILVIPKKCVL